MQRRLPALLLAMTLSAAPLPAFAQGANDDERSADQIVDVDSSIDDAVARTGWSSKGDFRALLTYDDEDARDGTSFDNTGAIARVRIEGTWVCHFG